MFITIEYNISYRPGVTGEGGWFRCLLYVLFRAIENTSSRVSYLFEHINPKKLLILVSALVGINYDSNSI